MRNQTPGAANQLDLFAPFVVTENKYHVIVAGGREFNDWELLEYTLDHRLAGIKNLVIVSGCARGADKLGEKWALKNAIEIRRFPAHWTELGDSAGHIRNEEMARVSDALIAFWNKRSTGTKDMIKLADIYKLHLHVVNY